MRIRLGELRRLIREEVNRCTKVENCDLEEVSPPGWEGTVKAMKKHPEIDNPWALSWHMKKKGYKSHKPLKERDVARHELPTDVPASGVHDIPDTIPADPDTDKTLTPARGSTADINFALAGMPSRALKAPRVPKFAADEW